MDSWLQDLRFVRRMLLSAPAVYLAAVLSLAVGIGANTAIFSAVNAVLLRPLPYEQPDRLVSFHERDLSDTSQARIGNLPPGLIPLSIPDFHDYRRLNRVFSEMTAYRASDVTVVVGDSEPDKVLGAVVLDDFFAVLRARPMLGRTFTAEEQQPGRNRVVVLSYGLWQEWFNQDRRVLGRKMLVNGDVHAVVGVMPAGFAFPKEVRLWRPAAMPYDFAPRGQNILLSIARLRPGVGLATAQASLNVLARRLAAQFPDSNRDHGTFLIGLKEETVGDVRPALLILWGAVGLVLLIACGNAANLLLARAGARQREMAIRASLGAGRNRLIRQLLGESLLLALAGGALGTLLAWWGLRLAAPLTQEGVPRAAEIGIDGQVLLTTLLLCGLASVVFGLAPALHSARPNLAQAFKEGGQRASQGTAGRRLRQALVIGQVGIAVALVIGAGLLMKSFTRLLHVNPGFRAGHVLTFQITLPTAKYAKAEKTTAFYRELLGRIRPLPGVESAGATFFLPFTGRSATNGFTIEGRPPRQDKEEDTVIIQAIAPDFFHAAGIPLLRGRVFTDHDDAQARQVAVIDDAMARRYWPDRDPIGQRITLDASFGPAGKVSGAREIVGVVGSIRYTGINQPIDPQLYFPNYQCNWRWMTVAVHTTIDPLALAGPVRAALRTIDGDVAAGRVQTLDKVVDDSLAQPRLSTWLMAVFAAMALLLSAIGIYAMLGYSVGQRQAEVAVRLAMGATRAEVFRLVVGEGLALGLAGLLLGLGSAFGLTRLMRRLLFEVGVADPAVFIGVSLLMALVMLLAVSVPAHRATRVAPVEALRG